MKNFIKEFKEFISRGNIIDLAVAVIIGGAFSAIVTALTQQIIMPLVNWALAAVGGKEGLESAYTILSPGYTDGVLDLTKSIYIDWGAFISAILNIFITLALVFRYGLIGAAFGTLVAMLYHTCYFVWYLRKNII